MEHVFDRLMRSHEYIYIYMYTHMIYIYIHQNIPGIDVDDH